MISINSFWAIHTAFESLFDEEFDHINNGNMRKGGFMHLFSEPVLNNVEGLVVEWFKVAAAWC
jgi:hypothetical protein